MPLVAGVDSSTQSTKVQVRDADSGAPAWSSAQPHRPTSPPCSEQDPEEWWQALHPQLDAAWTHTGGAIGATSVAAQQHGMVALDGQRRVLRPAKLWNDTEAAPDAARLRGTLGGPDGWARSTGSVPGAAFTVAKLAWLARCEPATFARLATVLLPHDWLTMRLCGELVTDRGDASGTGYFSAATGRWLPEVLAPLGLDLSAVPRVLGPAEPAGRVRDMTFGPGTGDNMATALGLGLAPGDLVVSVGTSGTVFTVAAEPTADPTGAVAGFADATGRFLPLVCTMNAAKVTDAFARLLGVTAAGLDELALSAPPGARGLVLVPYLDGERTPPRPEATGALTGIRPDVEPALVARAAVEGVLCGLLEGVDALVAQSVPVGGRVLLVGGGARSAAYRRILADLLQRPVTVPDDTETAATGACVQAASVLTGRPGAEIARAWGLGGGRTLQPDSRVDAAAVRAAWREQRDRLHPAP